MDTAPDLVTITRPSQDVRDRIRLGAPVHTGEANELAEQILMQYGPLSLDVQSAVMTALMQIVIARQLCEETHQARAAALNLLESIATRS